jgi:hypothetical protein
MDTKVRIVRIVHIKVSGTILIFSSIQIPGSCENIRILSIDFETRQTTDGNVTQNQIFAAGFYSIIGIKEVIHLEDDKFKNNEVKFLRYIVYKIQSFQGIITGWYLMNSDLVVLDEVCKRVGVSSPIGF